MWFISLRDLQFRQRRFLIAIVATGVVFALGLLSAGLAEAFRAETRTVVGLVGADRWIVPNGVLGPFTSTTVLPSRTARELRRARGVRRADPLLIMRHALTWDGRPLDVNVIGHVRGGLGSPPVAEGRPARRLDEIVVDGGTGVPLGAELRVGPATVRVVGRTRGVSYYAGTPAVFVDVRGAQLLAFRGERVASAIVTRGIPRRVPPGTTALEPDAVRADLLRPLDDAIRAVDVMRYLMWLVAAGIIGALIYLSALERLRDFAVLRAVGSSPADLYGGLALQSAIVSFAAGVLSIGLSFALRPLFPLPVIVPAAAYALLPVVAIGVGLLASLTGLRRTTGVDPALAFGGQ